MGAGHSLLALGAVMLSGAGFMALGAGRGAKLSPQALGIVGLLGMLLIIGGIVYVALMLPGAMLQDSGSCQAPSPCSSFIGSDSSSNSRASWGPGIGWMMGIPAAVIGLLGSLQMRSASRGVSPAPMFGAPPAAPYGAPAPGYGYPENPYGQPPPQQWPPDSGGQRGW